MRSAASASVRSIGVPVIAAMVALGGAVTGCAPSGPAPAPAAPPPVGAPPTLADAGGQILPIAEYLISPSEEQRIEAARTVLIASCMKRFGFDFAPPAVGGKPDPMARRYYLTDAASAAARGYHRAARPDRPGQAPAQESLSPEMQTVLGQGVEAPAPAGSSASQSGGAFNGIAVPRGGCLGEADTKLAADGGIIQDDVKAMEINGRAYAASMADARVKEVFAGWSQCMKEKGHSYATPMDAVSDPRWLSSATPTDPEIAAATADVGCKHQHNVVGVWFGVETAYQGAEVRTNLQHLQLVRKSIDTALRNAEAVTGGGASKSP
ncbi:hypothetical protein PUR61_07170 [Streptomyces sp. BE20]|uniref:hypothetical protein n=1 Tax=Streptomyces sp. BE20 TaxID=3002525 RepID=UPI002E78992E|nr:hypothetical protein [Streptomyces sp. BE20]MEE1821973.1 hypothetical protein [Streptomyces sp. BE20]